MFKVAPLTIRHLTNEGHRVRAFVTTDASGRCGFFFMKYYELGEHQVFFLSFSFLLLLSLCINGAVSERLV